ncbi:MAG: Fe-Mn family superoxide dismutase [bacterium]|nr:Fe-Mn family superoxide dismutase [bacterium]
MAYEAQNFDHLLGTTGFSDVLMQNHFTLYQGYVKNTNLILEKLEALHKAGDTGPEYAEMKRRFGWEFNGMRLHEYFFGNMTKDAGDPEQSLELVKKLEQQFGSFEAWADDFKALAAMRGIGWAILVHDTKADRLINVWSDEHDTGHLAGTNPLMMLDVFEHAFMLDYGMKRADYINAFFKVIDWQEVNSRYAKA